MTQNMHNKLCLSGKVAFNVYSKSFPQGLEKSFPESGLHSAVLCVCVCRVVPRKKK